MITYNEYVELAEILTKEFKKLGILDRRCDNRNGQTKPEQWGEAGRSLRTYADLPTVYFFLKEDIDVVQSFKMAFVQHFQVKNWDSSCYSWSNVNICLRVGNYEHPILDPVERKKAYKSLKSCLKAYTKARIIQVVNNLDSNEVYNSDAVKNIAAIYQEKLDNASKVADILKIRSDALRFLNVYKEEAENQINNITTQRGAASPTTIAYTSPTLFFRKNMNNLLEDKCSMQKKKSVTFNL